MSTPTAYSKRLMPTSDRESVFPSRVDAWLAAIVTLALAICFFFAWHLGSVLAIVIGAFDLLGVPCLLCLAPTRSVQIMWTSDAA